MEGISPCVLGILHSVLFSKYSALFYNVYYLQCLLLENDVITDAVERKNIFYSFQLKSFEHNNVILFEKKQKKKKKAIR